MTVTVINFAAFRIERLEFTRVPISLRQEDFCLLTGLNANDLDDDSQRCHNQTGYDNRGTDRVLLSHG
jgi:hypothetical protein